MNAIHCNRHSGCAVGNSVGLQTVQVREWMETRIFHFEIPIRDLKVIKPHSRRSVGLGGAVGDPVMVIPEKDVQIRPTRPELNHEFKICIASLRR